MGGKASVSKTEEQDESEMRAAINFGLQLREAQLHSSGPTGEGGATVSDSTRALIDEIQQAKANESLLYREIRQIKGDMREMLLVLREQCG